MEVEAPHVPSKFEYGCYALHAQTPWNLSDEVTCIQFLRLASLGGGPQSMAIVHGLRIFKS